MPLRQGYTTRNGDKRGYYQAGDAGRKYVYKPGNTQSREAARKRALRQLRAMYAED